MKIARCQLIPWFSILLCFGAATAQEAAKPQPIPLAKLPNLEVSAKALTLVEGKDNEAVMRLYLVNTSPDPIPSAIFGLSPAYKEAFIDGKWQRCQSVPPDAVVNMCADGILDNLPPPLSPEHAWEMEADGGDDGDVEAEIRFCLPLLNAAPLVTKPRKGHYSTSGLDNASKDLCSYWGLYRELHDYLRDGRPSGAKVFTNIGELAATLELERAYDKCGLSRGAVARWLEKNPKGFAKTTHQEMAALRAVLARPWTRTRDDRNRLEACLDALSQANRKKHPVGTPARYPVVVWRYLSIQSRLRMADESYQNPEQRAAIAVLQASGNDWGADPEELAKLGTLAEKSVNFGNPREAEAARSFLRFKVADVK